MRMRWLSHSLLFSGLFSIAACQSGKLNLFTPQQDVELGRQLNQEILSKPDEYPILPERGNEEVYRYVRNIVNRLLSSGKVQHRNDFVWEVKLIDDDKTLNAFATPGGFIYVYTGLIKFLSSEDELAGVLGHEIAHADQRHGTEQMTKIYGISTLLSIVTGQGDSDVLQQLVVGLLDLSFSRADETEADEYSVIYLCETNYSANGAAGFFRKMEGESSPPEFLSTHPNPGNRVAAIEKKNKELGCTGSSQYQTEYARIKGLLR
jgi:predicted Zn-dependent protease